MISRASSQTTGQTVLSDSRAGARRGVCAYWLLLPPARLCRKGCPRGSAGDSYLAKENLNMPRSLAAEHAFHHACQREIHPHRRLQDAARLASCNTLGQIMLSGKTVAPHSWQAVVDSFRVILCRCHTKCSYLDSTCTRRNVIYY